MIKLIATDMDGTFLMSGHRYDKARLRRLLDKFAEKEYLFVAASGRSLRSLENVFADFKDDIAFVAENGSVVSYKGKVLFQDNPISPAVCAEIIEGIEESPYGTSSRVILSGLKKAYLLENADAEYYDIAVEYYVEAEKVAKVTDIKEGIIKIVASFPEETMSLSQEWMHQRFPGVSVVTTGFASVDIILSDIHKAVGLSKLCDAFGIGYEDVVAFGDNQNDLEMLDFAGYSLATANARPVVKQMADKVIGHCNDQSVIAYMETLV